MSMNDAFDDASNFRIEIPEDGVADTGPAPAETTARRRDPPGGSETIGGYEPETYSLGRSIEPEYSNPAISISTGSRYVTHEIIGGATVRQRVGDEPLEIDISGVCNESTVRDIELLRNTKYVVLYSSRLPTESIRAQIVSISTDPFEEGGAVKLGDDEFLYSYTLNAVEIADTADPSD